MFFVGIITYHSSTATSFSASITIGCCCAVPIRKSNAIMAPRIRNPRFYRLPATCKSVGSSFLLVSQFTPLLYDNRGFHKGVDGAMVGKGACFGKGELKCASLGSNGIGDTGVE